MFNINRKYLFLTLLIFIVEVLIAIFVHDQFVRPYLGDVLVVILIYCFAKSFLDLPTVPLAMGVLAFAFLVETMQYFRVVDLLGLGDNKLARVVIGTSFAWEDFMAYLFGIALVLWVEKRE